MLTNVLLMMMRLFTIMMHLFGAGLALRVQIMKIYMLKEVST